MKENEPTPLVAATETLPAPTVAIHTEVLQTRYARILEKLNESNWGKEKILPYLITLKDLTKGMLFAGVPTFALLTATLELNHYRTRWKVESTDSSQGTEYHHEDEETTAILNYFAGRGSLPEHIQLAIYRDGIAKIAQSNNYTLPENFATMDKSALLSLTVSYFTPGPNDRNHFSSPKEMADTFFLHAIPVYKRNDQLHELLWKLEQEVGSPRIRFSFTESSEDGEERAFYRAPTNTAYIFRKNPFNDLVAEFAHAEQYDRNHLGSVLLEFKSMYEASVEALSKGISFEKAYDSTQYPTPGTLEHDAHKIGEQKLWKRLEGEKPTSTSTQVAGQETIKQ